MRKLLFLLAVTLLAGKGYPAEEALFRFVHITDQHFVDSGRIATDEWQKRSKRGTRDFQKGPANINKFVDWCNEKNVDFVVMTGDVLENMNYKESFPEFLTLSERLEMPYFVVPGNHDFRMEKLLDPKRGGVDFYFTAGGLVFAGIQTFNDMYTGMFHFVQKGSLERVSSLFAGNKGNPAIILAHSSIYGGDKVPVWAIPANAQQAREVFEKSGNVFAVLAGHIHIYTESVKNGITYITGPGFTEKPLYPFILWTVFPDRIEGIFFAVENDSVREINKGSVNIYPNRKVEGPPEPVVIEIPKHLQPSMGKIKPGDLQARTLPSSDGILKKIMGKDWSYFPGTEPVIWEGETVILPKGSAGWKYLKKSPKEKTEPDAGGKKWYEEGFVCENWEEGSLPASGKYRRNKTSKSDVKTVLSGEGYNYYWRLIFNLPEGMSKQRPQKAMLRIATDKCAVVYLNGTVIDEEREFHWADYWNRYVVFNASLLKEKDNTLAVKLMNPYTSSHSYLDVEMAVLLNTGEEK
jgi:Icc-related predicted phosphoesterase